MNVLHITDLTNGYVQVSWQKGNAAARTSPRPIPFSNPLTDEDRAELKWYLEDFLQFPYGAERYRAKEVERKMELWGTSLFQRVFVKYDEDPDPRSLYQETFNADLNNCELCIGSEDPAFLNIPWELMYDPANGGGYLAPRLKGFYRLHSGHRVDTASEGKTEGPFRILLVIARPDDAGHIPIGTEARSVLEALRPLRPRVELEVLRPPTFDALQKKLNAKPGHYDLVHFDGHGVLHGDKGNLAFEKENGKGDIVDSKRLGQLLANSKVPLFVLSACQTAQEGNYDPYSSIASSLIAIGAKGVVAMSYSVYVSASTLFMQRFYESLVEHKSLSEAVAEGRRRLFADNDRGSAIGLIPLNDWTVPALYQQEQNYTPISESASLSVSEDNTENDAIQQAEEACPEGQFGFIGRDNDILKIERAIRDSKRPWVLLTGIGGTGKTELANGFARWYAETGGCPGGVFATSFKGKADFGQVIGSIAGHGTDFSRLSEQEQWDQIVNHLNKYKCLLVWDNIEPVNGYPDGSEPLASSEERVKLSRFLKALKGGRSRVILTTRKPDESWLGVSYRSIPIGGLDRQDAAMLATDILETAGVSPDKFANDEDYDKLLKLLNGHPRSLEVVIPILRGKSPRDIIDTLQHRSNSLSEQLEDASLAIAFEQLSERTRKHLPFIGLFVSFVNVGTLGLFIGSGDEQQQIYEDIFGGSLDAAGWESVLEEARRAGLIRLQLDRIYTLHPTLSPFLRRQLGKEKTGRLDSEYKAFYAALTRRLFDALRRCDKTAHTCMLIEEANILRALRLAEKDKDWDALQTIAQSIIVFYESSGRNAEFSALRRHLLSVTGRTLNSEDSSNKIALWMFLIGTEANAALLQGEFEDAEKIYLQILNHIKQNNPHSSEQAEATLYHQLGIIAEERQQFDTAEQWSKKALEICERRGLERNAADEYHQLGIIAEKRKQFDTAEQWHKKALEICERRGLERNAADEYHQLGIIAEERKQFDTAEQWYKKALEIFERLGLEKGAAYEYHQLGIIAEKRKQFDTAEQWYKKALEIFERLGLEREAAADYHQMGIITQERQQFDTAEEWYKKALEIKERFNHPPIQVNTLAQLGVFYRSQNKFIESVAHLGKALIIAAEYKMPILVRVLYDIALTMAAMGEDAFIKTWKSEFPDAEPPIEAMQQVLEKIKESET